MSMNASGVIVLLSTLSFAVSAIVFVHLLLVRWQTRWVGRIFDHLVRERRSKQLRRDMKDEFPFFLSLIVIGLEGGTSLSSSIEHAVRLAPDGPMRKRFAILLEHQRAGRTLREALLEYASDCDTSAFQAFAGACVSAQLHGSDLAATLRDLASQLREYNLLDAEQRALKAPVRMIAPLVICIFPCTFVVLAFPIVFRLLKDGYL